MKGVERLHLLVLFLFSGCITGSHGIRHQNKLNHNVPRLILRRSIPSATILLVPSCPRVVLEQSLGVGCPPTTRWKKKTERRFLRGVFLILELSIQVSTTLRSTPIHSSIRRGSFCPPPSKCRLVGPIRQSTTKTPVVSLKNPPPPRVGGGP